jgi:hypothetical protein
MSAWEFIVESAQPLLPEQPGSPTPPETKLLPDQFDALPATYTIPGLPNQDPYLQYRFGVAIAGAKGASARRDDGVSSMTRESPFGEGEIVVSYGHDAGPYIDDALKQMGLRGKKMISSPTSIETKDVDKSSPLKAFKGYKR